MSRCPVFRLRPETGDRRPVLSSIFGLRSLVIRQETMRKQPKSSTFLATNFSRLATWPSMHIDNEPLFPVSTILWGAGVMKIKFWPLVTRFWVSLSIGPVRSCR